LSWNQEYPSLIEQWRICIDSDLPEEVIETVQRQCLDFFYVRKYRWDCQADFVRIGKTLLWITISEDIQEPGTAEDGRPVTKPSMVVLEALGYGGFWEKSNLLTQARFRTERFAIYLWEKGRKI
jgi:hypothetical protein